MSKKLVLTLIGILVLSLNNVFAAPMTALIQISANTSNLIPGKDGYITISLRNDGTEPAYSTRVTLFDIEAPLYSTQKCSDCQIWDTTRNFCIRYEDHCYIEVGDVWGDDSKEQLFRISIPKNITSGVYLASFDISYTARNTTTSTESTHYIRKYVLVNIANNDSNPLIRISDVAINPITAYPGGEMNASIKLTNERENDALDLRVSVNGGNFIVIGMSNEVYHGSIPSNGYQTINIPLRISEFAPAGINYLNLTLSYKDSNDNLFTDEESIGYIVGGETSFDLFISSVSPKIVTNDTETTVSINVANTGLLNAESVRVELLEGEGYDRNTVTSKFLGKLDAGDYTTASFNIIPTKRGEIRINMILRYTDSTGANREIPAEATMYLSLQGPSNQITSTSGGSVFQYTGIIVVIGICVFITYYFFKARRKRQQ